MEMLYEQLIYPQLQNQVGHQFKIVHLKSTKGKTLNGKTCKVTGFDRNEEARLHCLLADAKKPLSIKWQNLIPLEANQALEHFMAASTPISDDIWPQYYLKICTGCPNCAAPPDVEGETGFGRVEFRE